MRQYQDQNGPDCSEKDLTPPTISECPADLTLNNDVDKCGTSVTWPIPGATDNCTQVTVEQTAGPIQGAFLQVGPAYTVVYTAYDVCGNTSVCQFNITVRDKQTPTAVCKDITVDLSATPNAGDVTVYASNQRWLQR
ncbi:MAG: HYR domain-containing protein [Lewinellaceae bacterium]|nr:HYR domain-containing protein [Lewinellaceae bacterium]